MYENMTSPTAQSNDWNRGQGLTSPMPAAAPDTLENALQSLAALAVEVRDMSGALEDRIGGSHPRPAGDQKDRGMNVLSRVKTISDVLATARQCMNSTLNSLG